MVVAVQGCNSEVEQERLRRSGRDIQQKTRRADQEDEKSGHQDTSPALPLVTIQIRAGEGRSDVRSVEREQPYPPQHDDRNSGAEIQTHRSEERRVGKEC